MEFGQSPLAEVSAAYVCARCARITSALLPRLASAPLLLLACPPPENK